MRKGTIEKKPRGFAMGALTMTVAGVIAKAIGALYRIPLTNLLGAEGIGRYQLVFPLYALLISLTSGGLPAAMSRWVANRYAVGSGNAIKDALKSGLVYGAAVGLLGGALLAALAYPLGAAQGNASLAQGYLLLAPAVAIVAVGGALKGWLLGMGLAWLSGWSQVLEQIVKALSGWLLAAYLMRYGVQYGVLGALGGVALAELAGLAFCIAACAINRRKNPLALSNVPPIRAKEGALGIAGLVLPMALSGIVFPLSAFADSLIVIPLLGRSGVDAAAATGQYGILTGGVNTLINLPAAAVLALGVCVIPAVGGLLAGGDVSGVRDKTAGCLILGFGIGAPAAVAFFVLAKPLMATLYPALGDQLPLAVSLMRLTCVDALFLGQLELYNAVLQGMGRAKRTAAVCASAAVLKLILQCTLIPWIGIWGAAVATVAMYAVAAAANGVFYRRMVGKNPILVQNDSKILLASVIMGIVIAMIARAISSPVLALGVCAAVGGAIYVAILWLGGVLRAAPRLLVDKAPQKEKEE